MKDESGLQIMETIIADQAWVAHGLLTLLECDSLVSRAQVAGISSQQAPGTHHLRSCLRVELEDAHLASAVWTRIQHVIPQQIIIENPQNSMDTNGPPGILYPTEQVGRWTPYGVNRHWRIVCYPGKGHFGPHRDDEYKVDDNHRSLLTINGYLTPRPVGFGGATRFLEDDVPVKQDDKGRYCADENAVKYRVEADQPGKAVIFLHGLMHDGEPLLEGSPPKWVFRTEVMYRRDADSAPTFTKAEVEARQLLKEAESAEGEGDIASATRLYKRAYRLDPTLDA